MWMPHPIERVKRDAMAGTSGVLSRVESVVYGTSFTFDFPASNTMQREKGRRTAKPKLSRFSQFLVALFRIF